MPNLSLNLPAPSGNGAGAAVDVSSMGQLKTIIVGGQFDAVVTIEYATDDAGTVFSPIATFKNPGNNKTVEIACRWMRAVVSGYRSGAANADVCGSGAGCEFVELGEAPVSIAHLPPFKTVVTDSNFTGALNIEVSADGTSWAQVFSFQNKGGGQSGLVYGSYARAKVTKGSVPSGIWMAAGNDGDTAGGSGSLPYVSPDQNITIYVRSTGSDLLGDGKTEDTAYRTIQRAEQDVKQDLLTAGGTFYYIDATDLIEGGSEETPPDYALPCWKAPVHGFVDFANPYFFVKTAVNIFANPRLASNIPEDDAVITDTELVPTVIGTNITGVSATNPVVVTTATPHGLWATDFPSTEVDISGVLGTIGAVANGTFNVYVEIDPVTQAPYPDKFVLDGVDGSGLAYGGGGSAETLFVKDPYSGQIQVKTTKTWPVDALIGKMFVGSVGPFEHARIYKNTADTLYLTHAFAPIVYPGVELRIMEPSCKIETTAVSTFYRGGFNVANIDSCAINGIEIASKSGTPGEIGLFQNGGVCWVQGCTLVDPVFAGPSRQANSNWTHMTRGYYEAPIYNDRNLMSECGFFPNKYWFAYDGTVYDACAALEVTSVPINMGLFATKIRNQDNGLICSVGTVGLDYVSLENIAQLGVQVTGPCRINLNGVNGDTVPQPILTVSRLGQALVTDYSFTQAGDTMQVGDGVSIPNRTFADFHAGVGGPAGQYTDITAVGVTGATGSLASVLRNA